MPNRFMRFCCRVLKEYPILYNSVIGVRKCESRARNARYNEPVVCRVYNKKDGGRVQQILPILDWSDEEELEFIKERDIKLHPLYYRDDGTIDITQRLGCMCCPLKSPKKDLRTLESIHECSDNTFVVLLNILKHILIVLFTNGLILSMNGCSLK